MSKKAFSIAIVSLLAIGGLVGILTFQSKIVSSGTVVYVGTGVGNDTASIQDAIDNYASDGDTVFVYSGTYYEKVVVSKTINLIGENRDTTIIDGGDIGEVVYITANWVNLSNFKVINSSETGSGIYLHSSDYCKIENNNYWDNRNGIYIDPSSNNNFISNNTGFNKYCDINLDSTSDNTIVNNTEHIILTSSSSNSIISNNGRIYLFLSNGNKIENNTCSNNNVGIDLRSSSYNIIKNNTCYSNNKGILTRESSIKNELVDNNCSSNAFDGIYIDGNSNSYNIILNNTCNSNGEIGIFLRPSSHNMVVDNTCLDNGIYGIWLYDGSTNNTVEKNTCNSNGDGIGLQGAYGNVIKNNVCNSNIDRGILLGSSSHDNFVENNICLDNDNGIWLTDSDGNIINNNNCSSNSQNGISLYFLSNDIITNNIISGNYRGIWSDSTSDNIVENNICRSNTLYGIYLESSNNNSIYHNNIIDNTIQAHDDGVNRWNLSYPTCGNYWSDFDEPGEGAYDDYNGPTQDILGKDGIVDNGSIGGGGVNPYIIDADSQDYYPLIEPWNWTLEDGSGLQEGAPWPMFRGNVRHTGLSTYNTSGNPGELKWKFETGGRIESSPAISCDGTIYVGSLDNYLYAINSNGTLKWKYLTGDRICSTPAIDSNEIIYFGSYDDYLYAINPNGTLKWMFKTGSNVWSSPAIGSDGTIYISSVDGYLYAINPNGTLKWKYGGGLGSPALGPDSTIYVTTLTDINAIYPNGTLKWNFDTGNEIYSSPTISSDGTIYVGSFSYDDDNGYLFAIYPNGTEKWKYKTINHSAHSPAIGNDGTLYFGSKYDYFYALNPNGTLKWKFPMDVGASSPAIGSDGAIYVGSYMIYLFGINSNGTQKWRFEANDRMYSPAIDSDGTIYAGSSDYCLYAIGEAPNQSPNIPSTPSGPTSGITNISYSYSTSATDPDGNQIKYGWDWDGDEIVDEWSGLVDPGTEDNRSHSWSIAGIYNVKVKVQDENGAESDWSDVLTVTITIEVIDTDDDGIPDPEDEDDDNDGYNDNIEIELGTNTTDPDSYPSDFDNDFIPDVMDDDDDNDGYDDTVEVELGTNSTDPDSFPDDYDNDFIPDVMDDDDDNDGVNDTIDSYPYDPDKWSGQFSIEILGITLSKYGPSEGDGVTIYVEISNAGDNDCGVSISFYDGDPDNGGILIGIDQSFTILADSTTSASVSWMATAGNHTIYVIVEDIETKEKAISFLLVVVGENIPPVLILSTGDINIYRFEPGQERTISVEVTCYLQTVTNVHLVILDKQNLTINHTLTPPRTMTDGQTTKFYLRIKAPRLPEGVEKLEKDIVIQAVGDDSVFSNAEELDIVISKSALSFLTPVTIASVVATGSLATIGAAAAASRRNENWKYLLLSLFAVPLYTRIHGNKTLDNFVRGQVYGHIQSKPGTHFNEIRKTLRLGNGNLAYHLRKLEKEGFIKSKRDKRYRRFYPVGVEVPEENGIKLSNTQESILDFIERHPKSSQKEISKELKESQQTISYNINVLVREGFLREEKINGTKRYEIFDENT